MTLQYSPNGNLLYVRLRDGETAETAEVQDEVYLDFDAEGRPVGLELLNADLFFPFVRSVVDIAPGTTVHLLDALRFSLDRRYGDANDVSRAADDNTSTSLDAARVAEPASRSAAGVYHVLETGREMGRATETIPTRSDDEGISRAM